MIGRASTLPSGMRPFQRAHDERHTDAALQVWRFDPRSRALRDPLIVVPGMVGPPLSLKKMTSVCSSSFVSWIAAIVRPIASSIADSMAA